MANLFPDEHKYEARVTAEIWDLDGKYKTAVIELNRPTLDDWKPTFSFGIHDEEEFLEFYEQLCNAGRTLGWLV